MPHTILKAPIALPLTLFCALFLAACETEPESYPISGEECSPEDPVQDLRPSDCQPVPGLG